LASISERQKISLSYLEQLFGKLRRHKLVDSVRGPGGGYCIARPLTMVPWPTSFVPSMNNWMQPNAAAAKTVTTNIAA
jgi:hypothetical protein